MKTKKMTYRIVSAAICLTMLGAGAQVFAATSDEYVGYSSNGSLSAKVTCKIDGNDSFFTGVDYCEAWTTVTPSGIAAGTGLAIFNEQEQVINERTLTYQQSEMYIKLSAYDRSSAASAISVHNINDDTYGSFTHMLGCTFL